MRRLFVFLVPLAAVVAVVGAAGGCGADGEPAGTPATGETATPASTSLPPTTVSTAGAGTRGAAFVDTVSVEVAPDRRVTLGIAGQLPTPCHRPGWQAGPAGADGRLAVEVFSVPPAPDELCAQVLQPFTDRVELGPLAPGSYIAAVNGADHPFSVV